MKKNRFFSFSLYREGLRQIRVFAIVALVLMFLTMGISFAENCIEMIQYEKIGGITQAVANPMDLNPLLITTFLLCAPVMTILLFKFMNKRNQSDFYHAIPHPRQCVAVSFLAAAFTWIVIMIVTPTLCGALLYRLFLSKAWTLDIALVFSGILNTIVLSLLLMSAFFLAMTITGTGFSNGIVALLILFLPRFFLTIINAVFAYDIIPASSLSFPFGPYNMFFNLFFASGDEGLFPFNWAALLYTVGLVILYLVLGLILFKRRPSEAAGNPAPSRKVQAFHRIVLTCAIAFPLTLLFVSEPPTDAESVLLYVVGYIGAIIAYFIYELLSTRTVRNMVKIIPGLLIVAVACIGGTLISRGFYNLLLNDIPKAENVKEIYIEGLGDRYSLDESYAFAPDNSYYYFDEKTGEIPITDEACIQITTACLDRAVEQLKKDSNTLVFPEQYWAKVKFVCKNGHTVTRLVPIFPNEEDFDTLKTTLSSLPAYKNIYVNLPEWKDNFATDLSCGIPFEVLSADQRRELYLSLQKELKTVSADNWIAQVSGEEYIPDFATLYVYIPQNGKTLYMTLPIGDLTPETYRLLQKTIAAHNNPKEFKEAMTLPTNLSHNTFNYNNWNIDVNFVHDGKYVQRGGFGAREPFFNDDGSNRTLTEEEIARLINQWNDAVTYIVDHSVAEFDVSKDYISVNGYRDHSDINSNDFQNFYLFLPVEDSTVAQELLGLNEFEYPYETPLVEQFVPDNSEGEVIEEFLID